MRVLKRDIIPKTGEGFIRIQPDESEDMYHLYNILCVGDEIVSTTSRNVSPCHIKLVFAHHVVNTIDIFY